MHTLSAASPTKTSGQPASNSSCFVTRRPACSTEVAEHVVGFRRERHDAPVARELRTREVQRAVAKGQDSLARSRERLSCTHRAVLFRGKRGTLTIRQFVSARTVMLPQTARPCDAQVNGLLQAGIYSRVGRQGWSSGTGRFRACRVSRVQRHESRELHERVEVDRVLGPKMLHAAAESFRRRTGIDTELNDECPAAP